MATPTERIRAARAAVVAELRAAGCVFAEQEAAVLTSAGATSEELATMVRRRVVGEPLEHIVGWAEFRGMRIGVAPGVFVPRRRTELLVTEAAARAAQGSVVVDLCCGAGGVGVAMLAAVRDIELHAADIDPVAVRCARENIGARGTVWEGDLYEPLPARLRGHIDLLVVNTPYVPADEIQFMPPEARLHEPRTALDGGEDGLDIQRRVAAGAQDWLAPGGHLLIETSEHQAPVTAALFTAAGLTARVVHNDELDTPGAVIGTNPTSS